MNVLLVQPPVEDFYETEVRLQPIGLAYLKAAALRELPHCRVKILDFHRGWGRRTVALPAELRDLRRWYGVPDQGPFRTFYSFYRFGASFAQMLDCFRAAKPDVVGVSSLFTAYHREAIETARAAKAADVRHTILGGAHPSAVPLAVLEDPAVDFVIRGEGERPLVELLRLLKPGEIPHPEALRRVPGLAFKNAGSAEINPIEDNYPIDSLPVPDLEDLPVDHYSLQGRPLTFVITSRGCPHRCAFCSIHKTFPGEHRIRSAESVLDEVRLRVRQGYRVIDFEDDNLTSRKARMKELCLGLKELLDGTGVELAAMNGISYWSLDPELLALMRAAGFARLNVSMVASDQTVLGRAGRPHSIGQLKLILEEAFSLGFKTTCYQILGLPGDSLPGMITTMAFLASQPVQIGASPFYAAPGTASAAELGIGMEKSDFTRCRLTAMGAGTDVAMRRQVYTLFLTARILNSLKEFPVPKGDRILLDDSANPLFPPTAGTVLGLLLRFRQEGVLYAVTRSGPVALPGFDPSIFREVCRQAGTLRTLAGGEIDVATLGVEARSGGNK